CWQEGADGFPVNASRWPLLWALPRPKLKAAMQRLVVWIERRGAGERCDGFHPAWHYANGKRASRNTLAVLIILLRMLAVIAIVSMGRSSLPARTGGLSSSIGAKRSIL